ncbi:HD domain-containing protein [Shewanella submarina]|uniref:HD-GYP domain-containing protein n=1 Tax=Shewanella submarina TaxID=2016376 RepID=A0ABV7GCB1_9GAMM|nr:HD-GYP domain-containing protein [Shewanella submarina]MCL1036577.1 HD domain-containing protein [Shewanella submarina]
MAKSDPVQLPLSKVRVGHTVKLPLAWKDHPFWINRIKIEEPAQIEMIRGLGVEFVYLLAGELPPDIMDEEPEVDEVVTEVAQPASIDQQLETRKAIRLSQQRFLNSVNGSRTVFGKLLSDPEGSLELATGLVEELAGHLDEGIKPYLALVSSGESVVGVTQHSISVMVLAMMIGREMGLDHEQMCHIGLGALFHDIGKLKVPESIRNNPGELTTPERNFLKAHPNFGHEMLSRSGLFPEPVLHIVRHHHEYFDGSGYPDALAGKDIPLLTQIVSLVNDFDHLLVREDVRSPQVALGFIFKKRAGKHDMELIKLLVRVLGIYPPGTLVQLSDGSVGKVMLTSDKVKQPQVWSCTVEGEEPCLRFLRQEKVQVLDVVAADELAPQAAKVLQAYANISFYFISPVTA